MKTLVRYLGSLSFALFLIGTTALFVVLGTILESVTDSHLFAKEFTYSNPIFYALLAGFFLNILLSALRRWPFKWKHVPFLITHLALLLLILGVFLKEQFGLQGTLTLIEGQAKREIELPHSFSLQIEKRLPGTQETKIETLSLKKDFFGNFIPIQTEDGLQIEVTGFFPHGEEFWQSWIKDGFVHIQGLPKIPLGDVFSLNLPGFSEPWKIYGTETDDMEEVISKETGPAILFFKNSQEDQTVVVLNKKRETKTFFFPAQKLESLYLYDEGFSGFGVSFSFPFNALEESPDIERKALLYALALSLKTGLSQNAPLSPPLKVFKECCELVGEDFVENVVLFLSLWQEDKLLEAPLPLQRVLQKENFLSIFQRFEMDPTSLFSQITEDEKKDLIASYLLGCRFASYIKEAFFPFDGLAFSSYAAVIDKLPKDSLTLKKVHQAFTTFQAKELGFPFTTLSEALFFALPPSFLAHDVDMMHPISFETPLKILSLPKKALQKREDHIPLIRFKIRKQDLSEELLLPLNPSVVLATRPLFFGQYKIHLQRQTKEIPHLIWLHDARQINYPGSSQSLSYESSVRIKDLTSQKETFAILSMNHVFETAEGIRFYMANLSPKEETEAQKVVFVVNWDPFRYSLTYPAAALLVLGILWLLGRALRTCSKSSIG